MKMQLGVFVLLLMASIVMQQYLGFELLDTILTLGAVYVIVFWLFNFFKKRALETRMHPETYIKMSRLKAAYARNGSKWETEAKLESATGFLDLGRADEAAGEIENISPRLEYQAPSVQHLYKIVTGMIALFENRLPDAERALKRSTLDSQIHEPQKREVAFARALLYLTMRDKTRAEEQVARLNNPKNNREQVKRLYVLGWLLLLKGDREKAAQAMDPILAHARELWIADEAAVLKEAALSGKEYIPWRTVRRDREQKKRTSE